MSDCTVTTNSEQSSSSIKCPFLSCCKKHTKSKRKADSSVSEVNYILTKKKELLQLDSHTFMNNNAFASPFRTQTYQSNNNLTPINRVRTRQITQITRSTSVKKEIDKEGHKFFHEFKDKLRCFFCGGKKCKHENYKNNLKYNNAIYGLNSNFITNNVIASQRPSEVLITKYNLVTVFKELGIGLIVNLQREGEHPYCGPNAYNLTSAGYSYNPSVFTGDDIKCKLSGWKDMAVPSSMNFMLDIVKDMSAVINDQGKKVLVHCHAGYGRTGVVIACYMLFNSEDDSDTVISIIREKRRKCIETKNQRSYCKKFEDFLNHSRILFGTKESIDVYLKRQEDLLYGLESQKYGFVPKIITKTLERILCLKNKYSLENVVIYKLLLGMVIDWNEDLENVLVALKNMLNKNNWLLFDQTENLIILTELLFDWLEDCVDFVVSPERTENILYSDIFMNYMNSSKSRSPSSKNDELFHYIRKNYHCFEYEILYTFGSFFALFPPKGKEENQIFIEMLDRISLELLGFSLSEVNSDPGYLNSTKPLVTGLTAIIKLICDSFNQDSNDMENEAATPVRKHSMIFTKFKFSRKDIPNAKDTNITNITNSFHMNSSMKKDSDSMVSTPTPINVKILDPKEKKLFKVYEILSQHFQSKAMIENSGSSNRINNNLLLGDQISPFSINPNEINTMTNMNNSISTPNSKDIDNNNNDNFLQTLKAPMKSKELSKVIEEALSRKANASSSVIEEEEDKENIKPITNNINEIRQKFASTNSIINLSAATNNNYINAKNKSNSIISFESFQKVVLESKNSPKKSSVFFRNDILKNMSGLEKILERSNSKKLSKGTFIMEEIKEYQRRKSSLIKPLKMRTFGYDMNKMKNKTDMQLIDLSKRRIIDNIKRENSDK